MKSTILPVTLFLLLSIYCAYGQDCFYFQSRNHPDRYFGLSGVKGVMVHFNSARAYRLVPGLTGVGVSFQSCADPTKFLRHFHYIMWEHKDDSTPIFKKDATYYRRDNLFFSGYSVFESVNFPYYYIRHSGFVNQINHGSSTLFRNDASYKLVPTNYRFYNIGNTHALHG